MSLALSAVAIIVVVLPGVILRYAYARGSWAWHSVTSSRGVTDEIAYSVAFALGLHMAWLPMVTWLGARPDLFAALVLISGGAPVGAEATRRAFESVSAHPIAVGAYFLSLYLTAAVVGHVSHWVVRRRGWDIRYPLLRFRNVWHYYLSGEAVRFDEVVASEKDLWASAVVTQGEDAYLYQGFLKDFWYGRHGELEALVLIDVVRRRLADDPIAETAGPSVWESDSLGSFGEDPAESTPQPYAIPGDFLVVRYDQIRTLNLEYFELQEDVYDLPQDAFEGLAELANELGMSIQEAAEEVVSFTAADDGLRKAVRNPGTMSDEQRATLSAHIRDVTKQFGFEPDTGSQRDAGAADSGAA